MKKNYRLSVCITCYNQIEYIERAVESVRKQNMDFPYEILIGDDGSDDGSYEFIQKEYGHLDNIRIFQQERDENVHEFPNFRHARLIVRLMQEVQGEFFSIMDGDDYYCDPDSFQRKIEILRNAENQDCVLCMSNFKYVYDDGSEQIANQTPLLRKRDFQASLFGEKGKAADAYCHLSTAVIRSSIIKYLEVEYTQDFADTAVLWWAMNYGMRYYDDHVTYAYFKHKGTIFSSIDQSTKALRFILSADVINLQWKNKYRKYTRKRWGNTFLYLYKLRKQLPQIIDYAIWFPCAKRYKGWGYELLNYTNAGIFARIRIDLKAKGFKILLVGPKVLVYIKECILFICNRKIPFTEKVHKICNRKGM